MQSPISSQSSCRWWGPKALVWLILVVITFFIPNGFFIFWGNYVALIGATIFILLGLVLLVDFAHSWSETCLENWENSNSNLWQWILIGSTAGMYTATIALTGVMYAFFASSGCTLNRFFISINLALCIIVSVMCIHPAVQENSPRSGLAQSSMVAAYCTYLIMSAVGNHQHEACNPLLRHGAGTVQDTRNTTLVFGAVFTFLAIAYSTSRAATQSRALVGKKKGGAVQLSLDDGALSDGHPLVTSQPSRTDTPRYQALLAAVEAGCVSIGFYYFAIDNIQFLGPYLLLHWMRMRMKTTKTRVSKEMKETTNARGLVTTLVYIFTYISITFD